MLPSQLLVLQTSASQRNLDITVPDAWRAGLPTLRELSLPMVHHLTNPRWFRLDARLQRLLNWLVSSNGTCTLGSTGIGLTRTEPRLTEPFTDGSRSTTSWTDLGVPSGDWGTNTTRLDARGWLHKSASSARTTSLGGLERRQRRRNPRRTMGAREASALKRIISNQHFPKTS